MSVDKDNTNTIKNTAVKAFSLPVYGMMWDKFFKNTDSALESLYTFYSMNDFKTNYKCSIEKLNIYYKKNNESNYTFLIDEIKKQTVVFDIFSPSKNIIVEL